MGIGRMCGCCAGMNPLRLAVLAPLQSLPRRGGAGVLRKRGECPARLLWILAFASMTEWSAGVTV